MFTIGNQRVGIVTQVPVLDVHGDPVVTEFGEPVYGPEPDIVWVEGCQFEVQVPRPALAEQQNMTVTTNEIAWCHLPVTDDTRAITSSKKLRHADLTYDMRGDAAVEIDIRGREDHVFALCERQMG